MAHHKQLHSDLFILVVCIVFQSLCSSSALASQLDPPIFSHRGECYPHDRDALLDIAASSPNNSVPNFSGVTIHWGSQEQDCCHWVGVTCGSPFNSNSSGNPKLYSRVVGLTLPGNTFDSSTLYVPLAICRLSALISLDLSKNALYGPIPTCFGHNLTSLHTLILSTNFLLGSLSPLANLSLLTHLDVSRNRFMSVPASSIAFSANLTYMDLSFIDLHGALSSLKLPHTLEYLDLRGNSLSGSGSGVYSFIKGLSTNLRYLDLGGNDQLVISLTPAAFSTTPLLEYLDLGQGIGQVKGDIRVLEHLQHLEVLSLGSMSVPAHHLGSLFCNLGSLQSLSIPASYNVLGSTRSGGRLDGALLCEKPASVNLSFLYLDMQGYTGPFPKWFGHFASLHSLFLSGNQFEGSIPQEWHALTQLYDLELSGESPPTPVSLSQEVQSWLFRLPLSYLTLQSMGLTSQDFSCACLSLLNHTLLQLDLSDNHISPGRSLLHCLQSHNFSLLNSLDLSKNPLSLPLQPDMFPVSLQALFMSDCQLFGSLSNIGTLPSATTIDFSHNNLTNGIPLDIDSTLLGPLALEVGISLDLSHNKLTGIIPSSIWNLSTAIRTGLDLSSNYLHGEVILSDQALSMDEVVIANNYLNKVSFHNVSHLGFLDLRNNQLGGTLESFLGDYSLMKSLMVLLLQNNRLIGSIPTSLGSLAPSLVTMDLSNNELTGGIPPSLQHLQALQSKTLDIVASAFPYSLQSVKNVDINMQVYARKHLDLSSNQLNGSIPDGLGALVGLNDLNLSRNQLMGPIPSSFSCLASLESLDLSFNNLEGIIPSELSKLTSLEVFNVSFNPELSGKIPEGPQLETASSYEGDHKLCGEAISRTCTGDQQVEGTLIPTGQEPSNTIQTLSFKERFVSFIKGIEEWVAIPAIILGHFMGMGITFLALKRLHFYK